MTPTPTYRPISIARVNRAIEFCPRLAALLFHASGCVSGIAAVVSLYGLFTDATTISSHLSLLFDLLPSDVITLVGEQVKSVAQKSNNTLGRAFLVSVGPSHARAYHWALPT